MDRLKELGLPGGLRRFIYDMIAERTVHRQYGELDEMLRCSKRLTQGGVLSSSLYSLYTRGLETRLGGVKIVQFADDVCVHSENSNVEKALAEIEAAGIEDHL